MKYLTPYILVGFISFAKGEETVGHMQPLGSHMPPKEVDTLNTVPNPVEFFENYVKPGKPVVLRGAAKTLPSYENWKNDDYLREKAGKWIVSPEIGKKEDRDLGTERMIFKDFLQGYKNSDIYLVEDIVPPNPLAAEVYMIKSTACGGIKERLTNVILWFSSGGTKSVLHNDGTENLNCIFDGTKDLVLFDRKYGDRVPVDPSKGYSDMDVEKVDMYEYSTLQNLPWHHAHMETGDCLYIPFRWYHHVNSSNTRNLAINIWWKYMHKLDLSDCPDDLSKVPDYRSLQDWKPVDAKTAARSQFSSIFCDKEGNIPRSEVIEFFQEFLGKSESEDLFESIDRNEDGHISTEEVEYIPDEVTQLAMSGRGEDLLPYEELDKDKRRQDL